jgi:hypothetical protein
VRCGEHLDKVVICHNTGSASNPNNTLCVALPAAKNHIAQHGDQLAACGTVKICNDGGIALRTGAQGDQMLYDEPADENVAIEAHPNPFSSVTTIRFKIYQKDFVVLKLVDVSGKEMKFVYNGIVEANKWYEAKVNGSNYSSGMYFLQLSTRNGNNGMQKLLLMK